MHRIKVEAERLGCPSVPNININLPPVPFKWEERLSVHAGLRPFREDGVRLEKEKVQGKTVYHNYGHGGGGVSLGYGCARHVIENLFVSDKVPLSEPLAVLGSGVIGLTTALLLLEKGYSVNIYAELFPFQNEQGKPQITSTVAAAYWMPTKVGHREQTSKLAIDTYRHFQQMYQLQKKTGKQLGIDEVQTYCIEDDEGFGYYPIPGLIDPKEATFDFGDGVKRKGVTFPSLVAQTGIYLKYLIDKINQTGRAFFNKEILTSESVFAKKEKYLFNCCGLGGANLFGDKSKNWGIKGQVIAFDIKKIPTSEKFVLFLKTEGRYIFMCPQPQMGRLVLGASSELGKTHSFPEDEQIQKIYETATKFFANVDKNRLHKLK